jgi:hypothetical protein
MSPRRCSGNCGGGKAESSVKGEGLPMAVSKLFSSGELGRELDRMPSENAATLGADRVSLEYGAG